MRRSTDGVDPEQLAARAEPALDVVGVVGDVVELLPAGFELLDAHAHDLGHAVERLAELAHVVGGRVAHADRVVAALDALRGVGERRRRRASGSMITRKKSTDIRNAPTALKMLSRSWCEIAASSRSTERPEVQGAGARRRWAKRDDGVVAPVVRGALERRVDARQRVRGFAALGAEDAPGGVLHHEVFDAARARLAQRRGERRAVRGLRCRRRRYSRAGGAPAPRAPGGPLRCAARASASPARRGRRAPASRRRAAAGPAGCAAIPP